MKSLREVVKSFLVNADEQRDLNLEPFRNWYVNLALSTYQF
jgi:hypothetical protein